MHYYQRDLAFIHEALAALAGLRSVTGRKG
jgi:hypothetical protein